MHAADVRSARVAAFAATVGRVRAITAEMPQRAATVRALSTLEFQPPSLGEPRRNRHLPREAADGFSARYLNALNSGHATRPHDHTGWAVVVAAEQQELNAVYRDGGDGRDLARCVIEVDHEIMVERGRGVALMPDDIDFIQTTGLVPACRLPIHGRVLERLDGRRGSTLESGQVLRCKQNVPAVGEPAYLVPP